jgi:hypothetical protein
MLQESILAVICVKYGSTGVTPGLESKKCYKNLYWLSSVKYGSTGVTVTPGLESKKCYKNLYRLSSMSNMAQLL